MIPYSLDYISKVLNVNSRPKLDISHLRTRMERLKGLGIDYQPKCGTYVIPKEMIENPIDYDFVMFVNVGFDKENANTLAYAAPCLKDLNHNGRPVMGYSYYNTKNMNLVMDEFQENVETAIHEFLHAFGFSGSMAQHFLDENGRPRGDSVIKKVVKRGMPTSIIDLPKLTKFAREYFDCPDIEGVEMENQGGSGSLGSHFEHRMVRDDLMNSHDDYNRQFTEFLAILLEETHWYRVNRKYVGQSITGYKAGCRYIDEKCVSSYDSSSKTATVVNNLDFCSKLGKEGMCNTQYTHGSYCGTQSFDKYTGIEKAFDYFDGLMMTRGSSNGDNCPLKNGFEGDNCVDGTRTNRYSSYFEQSFGDDSRCVTGSYMKSGYRPY